MTLTPEDWDSPQEILVLLAHPDDPEFFCGATLARWSKAGHHIHYCLFTRGDKGGSEIEKDPKKLALLREREQNAAAKVIGVESVEFLDYQDGYLIADLDARKSGVRAIRKYRPNILMTCDPTNRFHRNDYLNHPDHLAAGQIALDAAFPAAGNELFFPDLKLDEGLKPVELDEIWISLTTDPNVTLDVTDSWETKIEALKQHKSQIGDPKEFDEHMREWIAEGSTKDAPRFEEKFKRLNFR